MADKSKQNEGIASEDIVQQLLETTNKCIEKKPSETKIQFHELNFFAIPTQSNIYGLASLTSENCTRLLVATLRGKIYSLTFNQQSMQSSLKPVGFSYIPALAEIISIDMFVTDDYGPIVGVTLIIKKDPNSSKEIFFNIYGLHTKPIKLPDWEKIAEDWQTQNLSYTPFLLTHTQVLLPSGCGSETVFLLSGDDCKVHVYRHINEEIGFREELPSETLFPEFEEVNSSITCMDFFINNNSSTRLTAFGCQNGYIRCSKVDLTTNRVSWYCDNGSLDGPITSVRLFSDHTHNKLKGDFETIHLLVTSAVEIGCVFTDILQTDLKMSLILQDSQLYDSVLCSEVADTNWNGRNEVILGTYGKKLLVYSVFQKVSGEYDATRIYEREFAHPIQRIMYCDITCDGLCEIIVLSTAGLHVLQHDLSTVCEESNTRLENTKELTAV